MRVVSQDGMIDVPYELTAIHGYDKFVKMNMAGDTGKGSVLATYSTEAKAIKAMEMLRNAYVGKLICQNIDMTKDVEELLKSWNTQAIITGIAHSEPKIDYINNTIFQFPKDEDVEVDDEVGRG